MLAAIPSTESTPPLYYVLAWGWSRIFGTGEVGLRALSAVLGTATISVAYAVACFFISRRAGSFAAVLVACSPLLVWYSQEARSYALLAFLSVLSALAFGHALRGPTVRSLSAWAAVSLWLLLAHGRRLAVCAAVAVPAIAGAALMPLALRQQNSGQTWWIGARPLSGRIRDASTQFVTGAYAPPHHAAPILAFVAVTIAAGGLAWLVDERERAGTAVVMLLGGITMLAPIALAPTRFDKFFYRNVIGCWPLLAIGLAAVLATRRARRLGPILLAAACAVEIGALAVVVHRPALERDDWRSATRRLGRGDTPLAIITNPSYERAAIELYRPDLNAMPPGGVSVREITFLGFARLPLDFRPPTGFKRLEQGRIQHIAFVRYQATTPRVVKPARLAARGGLSAAGVLWTPR
jgi:mannosyltransferase